METKFFLLISLLVLLNSPNCIRNETIRCTTYDSGYSFPLSALGKRIEFCLPSNYRLNSYCMQDAGYSFCFIRGASSVRINLPYNEARPFPPPANNYLER